MKQPSAGATFTFSLRLGCLSKFEPLCGNLQPCRFVQRINHLLSYVGGFFGSLMAITQGFFSGAADF